MEIVSEVDAKKESFPGEAAWEVIADAEKVYVASGKKIIEFVPADADRKAMLARITGPSGNLRAPALRRGKVFYIGFHPAMYEEIGKR
jgi:hypothetical protein